MRATFSRISRPIPSQWSSAWTVRMSVQTAVTSFRKWKWDHHHHHHHGFTRSGVTRLSTVTSPEYKSTQVKPVKIRVQLPSYQAVVPTISKDIQWRLTYDKIVNIAKGPALFVVCPALSIAITSIASQFIMVPTAIINHLDSSWTPSCEAFCIVGGGITGLGIAFGWISNMNYDDKLDAILGVVLCGGVFYVLFEANKFLKKETNTTKPHA